jgi:hypothetical protein
LDGNYAPSDDRLVVGLYFNYVSSVGYFLGCICCTISQKYATQLNAWHGCIFYVFALPGVVSATSYIILHNSHILFFPHDISFHHLFHSGTTENITPFLFQGQYTSSSFWYSRSIHAKVHAIYQSWIGNRAINESKNADDSCPKSEFIIVYE